MELSVDAETKKILDERLQRAMLLLTEKRHILEQVSSMLLAKEVLEGEEFDAIVQSDKAAVA